MRRLDPFESDWHGYEINPWFVGVGLTVGIWGLIELCVWLVLS